MKSFIKQYSINSSMNKVWDALTEVESIQKWSGDKVVMGATPGSEFSLWENTIWGTNTEIIPYKKLVQDWYGGKWDQPSKVTFELSEKDGIVEIKLTHENLPDSEAESFSKGWDEYYMGPLKEFCEA